MSPESCSALSAALDEPLAGSAAYAPAWLLVEQPGPYGRFALRESRLDPELGAELERRCGEAGVNVLLVKQPGRKVERLRQAFLVSSRLDSAFIHRKEFADPRLLLELDLLALARGEQADGDRVEHPLFLVCTNGKRDACCARLGRPIAQTLAAVRPDETWECSHTGGHRFAGVLICLPDGLVYGRLSPEAALRAIESYEAGCIEPEWFRGRSSYEAAAQAADAYLRRQEGIISVDGPAVERNGGGEVLLRYDGGRRYLVRLRRVDSDPPRPTSCRDVDLPGKRPPAWVLESVERV